MKTNRTSNAQVSANDPAASLCKSPLCRSSLQLFRQGQTDLLDAAIRVSLLLCLVVSLGIFGAEVTAHEQRPVASAAINVTPAPAQLSLLAVPAKAGRALSAVAARAF